MRFSVSFGAPLKETRHTSQANTALERMKTESIRGAVSRRGWIGLSGRLGFRMADGKKLESYPSEMFGYSIRNVSDMMSLRIYIDSVFAPTSTRALSTLCSRRFQIA